MAAYSQGKHIQSTMMPAASPTQASNPASYQIQVKVEPMEVGADSPDGCCGCGSSDNLTCDGGSFKDGKNAIANVKAEDLSDESGRVEESFIIPGPMKGEGFEFGHGQIILQGKDFKVEQDPDFDGDTDSVTETKGEEKKLSMSMHHGSSIADARDTSSSAQASARLGTGTISSSDCVTSQLAPFCAEKCSPPLDQLHQSISASVGACQPVKQYPYVHCEENFHKRKSTGHHMQNKCSLSSNAAGDDVNARRGRGESVQISDTSLSRSGGEGGSDEVELETGQQEHARRRHKKHQCQECGQKFGWSSHLKSHMENVHRGEKNHPCPQCGKDFSLRGTLNRHLKTVHQGERRYMCFECGGNFSRQSVLDRHVETVHHGQRKHKCSLCEGTFGREGDLERHMATVHRGERKYPCAECDKSFGQISHLKSHVLSIHRGVKKR